MEASSLFVDLIILLGATILVATIFHFLRLPLIVGFLGAGLIAGPYGLQLVSAGMQTNAVTEIAAILLMFTIGLEFSFRRLRELRRSLFVLGGAQILITLLIGAGATHLLLGFNWEKAIFFGFLISLSSTAVVLKLLQDARDLEAPYGNSSVSILLAQDLAVIPMIVAIPLLAGDPATESTPFTLEILGSWLLKTVAIGFGLVIGARRVVPFILKTVVATRSRELFFFSLMFLCFGVAWLLEHLELSLSLGAFFAGVMISESPYGKQAMSDILPLRDNFLGFFFAAIGMLLNLPFALAHFHWILLFTVLLFALKSLLIFIVTIWNGYSGSIALFTGLLLFQVGEFSFILLERGLALNLLSETEYQYFLAVSIISLGLTPFFYKLAPRLVKQVQFDSLLPPRLNRLVRSVGPRKAAHRTTTAKKREGHAVIIGYGVAGQNIAQAFRALQIPYVILDLNPDAIGNFPEEKDHLIYGDARQTGILESAQITTARLVIITVSGAGMAESVLQTVRHERPDLPVIVRAQYLRELNQLAGFEQAELVVAEFETALEILARTLKSYGVTSREIHQLLIDTRRQMTSRTRSLQDSLRRNIDLPTWETLAALRPFVLRDDHFAVGHTLADLNIRFRTGASVVLVYREGLGSTIPQADFQLQAGDVIYLIGSDDAMTATESLLTGGLDEEDEAPDSEPLA